MPELSLKTYWKDLIPSLRRGGRGKKLDLVGQKFGRLVVVEWAGSSKSGVSLWRCKCMCGKVKVVGRDRLQREAVKSCGCLRKRYLKKKSKTGIKRPLGKSRYELEV